MINHKLQKLIQGPHMLIYKPLVCGKAQMYFQTILVHVFAGRFATSLNLGPRDPKREFSLDKHTNMITKPRCIAKVATRCFMLSIKVDLSWL